MIKITFDFADLESAAAALTALHLHHVKPKATNVAQQPDPVSPPEAKTPPEVAPQPEPAPKAEKKSRVSRPPATGGSEAPAPAASAPEADAPKGPTLEEVRAKLAAISQAGKTAEVRAAIQSLGAERLTDVPPARFTELLEKVGAL